MSMIWWMISGKYVLVYPCGESSRHLMLRDVICRCYSCKNPYLLSARNMLSPWLSTDERHSQGGICLYIVIGRHSLIEYPPWIESLWIFFLLWFAMVHAECSPLKMFKQYQWVGGWGSAIPQYSSLHLEKLYRANYIRVFCIMTMIAFNLVQGCSWVYGGWHKKIAFLCFILQQFGVSSIS